MNQIDEVVKALGGKFNRRLARLKVLREALGPKAKISPEEAAELITRQRSVLESWTAAELIDEFIDPEELLIRELSKML